MKNSKDQFLILLRFSFPLTTLFALISCQSPVADRQSQPASSAPNQEDTSDWERKVDELMSIIASEKGASRRRESFHQVQQILAEQAPMIPLVARHTTVAAATRLGNYRPSTILPYSLWNAEEIYLR